LLARLQGSRTPASATVALWIITAAPSEENSLDAPDKIHPVETTLPYRRDLAVDLPPYTVAVAEIRAK